MRRASILLAVFGLLAVPLGFAPPAGAAGTGSAAGAAGAAVVLVEGTVQSDAGPAAGARVLLYEWPSSRVLSQLRPGQAVPWRIVASSTTSAAGTYTLSVAPSAVLPLAAPDGMANLELFASSAAARASFSFPRQVTTTHSGAVTFAPVDPATGSIATLVNLQLHPDPEGAWGASTPQGVFCSAYYQSNLGSHWDVVGQTYSVTTDVTHTFVYESGTSSSLGVGVSVSGKYGSWSAGGTASQSSTVTEGYPTYSDGRQGVYYESAFDYGSFWIYGPFCGPSYQAQVTGYAGGASTSVSDQVPGTLRGNCVHYFADTSFTRTSSNAVEWTDGLNITAVLGINLSTQTGYSSTATVHFAFNALRDMCGTNGAPGGLNPSQFVARSYIPGT